MGELKVRVKKTGVKKRNLNPVWDEEHTFTIASVSDHDRYLLTVEVWDEDRFTRDDFMGRAEIDLKPLFQEEEGKKVVAKSNNNFLEKDSNILKHEDGRRAQEVCLKLRGVHSGLLDLNLEYKKPAL
uniref:C2 domain-containing protein n=1 Tax=Picea sitchensis TaxID=3332 RepID=A9NSH0_PICSI|nr:unknown [Picea sitchensis]